MNEDGDIETTRKKWRHRRFMAYAALFYVMATTLLVVALAVFSLTGDLKDFISILVAVNGGLITLTGAYFGLATWYDRR